MSILPEMRRRGISKMVGGDIAAFVGPSRRKTAKGVTSAPSKWLYRPSQLKRMEAVSRVWCRYSQPA